MMKLLKVLSVLVVLGGIGYGGYYAYENFLGGGLDPELAMPKDLTMVFAFDHSNAGQVGKFDDLLDKFPQSDPGIQQLKELYNKEVPAPFSYEELEKLLDNDWKVVIGVKMNIDEDIEPSVPADNPESKASPESSIAYAAMIDPSSDSVDASDLLVPTDEPQSLADTMKKDVEYTPPIDVYVAGVFDSADQIEALLTTQIKDNKDYIFTEKDGIKYWENEANDTYILRYGKMFALTNSAKNRDQILDVIKNRNGLIADESFKKMKKESGDNVLAYAYINIAELAVGEPEIASGMGAVYSVLRADKNGFKTKSYTELKLKNLPIIKEMVDASVPSIIEKVNATNIIAYSEVPGFSAFLEGMAEGFSQSMMQVGRGEKVSSEDFVKVIAETLKIDEDDINALLGNSVAFSVSAENSYYPSISMYMKIDEKSQASAERLMDAIDKYADEVVVNFQNQFQGNATVGTGDEKQDFINATIEVTCYIFSAENMLDPEVESHSKAIYEKYGFDITDNEAMAKLSDKYSSDNEVKEAISSGIASTCQDKISAGPELQSVIESATDGLLSDASPGFFIKKEIIDTNGMDLTHWYVDWNSFPDSEFDNMDKFFREQLKVEEGIKVLKVGFYYGFPEEGMMILSLQPDLVATYGKNPLSADPIFKEGMSRLEDEGWVTISYFKPENLFLILNNYLELASSNPFMAGTITKAYNSVDGILSTFKYFVSGQKLDGDVMVSEGYAKIEKLEKATAADGSEKAKDEEEPQSDIPEDDPVQPSSDDVDEPIDEPNITDDTSSDDAVDQGDQPILKEEDTAPKVKRVK